MIIANRTVGRLIEVRGITPFADSEIDEFTGRFVPLLTRSPGAIVCCVDLRASKVLPENQATRFVQLFRRDNPLVERSALLVEGNATLGLQVARMVREAGNPSRRVFTQLEPAVTWLAEALDAVEQKRLQAFLAEIDADVARSGRDAAPASVRAGKDAAPASVRGRKLG